MSRTQGNRTGDNRLITFVLVRLSDLSQQTALETLRALWFSPPMRRTVLLLLAHASCVGGVFAGKTLYDRLKSSPWTDPGPPSYGYDDDNRAT